MYIPGWEVRILKSAVFSTSYGFIVDYLAEILKELRKSDYSSLMDRYVELDASLTTRDKTSVRKTFSGLAKLLFPHKEMTEAEVLELLDFAVEGRKRVKDQLYIIDETFKNEPVEFNYRVKSSGKIAAPETLEKMNFATQAPKVNYLPINDDTGPDKEQTDQVVKERIGVTNLKNLNPHQLGLKDNQTGISYHKLFGEYLKDSSKIQLQDPYIRLYYQFKNLLEFCLMLSNVKSQEEEIDLHVVTWNNQEYMADSIANFEEMQESVADLGIHLTYEFSEVHDRFIISDNGWKINLGRGLDIFDRNEGKFNAADLDQTKRKCKACDITFLRVLHEGEK